MGRARSAAFSTIGGGDRDVPSTMAEPPSTDDTAVGLVVALSRVARALKLRLAEHSDDSAVYYLLYIVSSAGPLRMTGLAALAGLDHSTVSRHVTNLIDAGHVSRQPDPTDRRAWRLELTDTGRQVLAAALGRRADVLAAATKDWPEGDRRRLVDLLEDLAVTMSRPRRTDEEPA
jgi:DNA-binding MarR family transcriptional regulator